ncbi:glycosyltransferase family 2 protein [Marinifilum sp. RC60d5]|uniref:glycosyltransferase family 2 protein n=1 Tax=Marinifilum sp. RC60d5 TaxID=3458414 RepID=UPI0040365C51
MKISIITVTYNSSATIEDCIASVNNQTYLDIEHIIIDGASKDDTVNIIESLPNRVSKIVSEPDKGIYDAMNKGINLATGDIVGILNSDDLFYDNDVLQNLVDVFESEEIDCVYGNLVFFNSEGKITRKWKSKPYEQGLFSKSWSPAHPTFYCKKGLYDKYGLYKIDYKIAADVELMLRFLELNKVRSRFTDKYMVRMLTGGVSTQGIKSTIIITKELRRAFKENQIPFNLVRYLFYKFLKIKEFIS